MLITLFSLATAQARDDSQFEYSLALPCATIITHVGSLQEGNCHYEIVAKTFSQKVSTGEQAIKLVVELKNILDKTGILIDLSKLPQEKNYIDPKVKFHKYQLTAALPKIYLVKVQDQGLYSEETALKPGTRLFLSF